MDASDDSDASSCLCPTVQVGDLRISRIVGGCWQLAGGHGCIDHKAFLEDLRKHAAAGGITFDTADMYGPSEGLLGRFLLEASDENAELPVNVMTKFCSGKGGMPLEEVRSNVLKSLHKLGGDSLPLLAMHWWCLPDGGDVQVAQHLTSLKHEGLIRNIGVCNYDQPHLENLLKQQIPVVSNQIQFSLLDRRPVESGLTKWCHDRGVAVLAFGALAGGLLSERWLDREPPRCSGEVPTPSLQMYYSSLRHFGSWELFQDLLFKLKTVGERHNVTIANVAVRWVLEQTAVAAVLIGMRDSKNVKENMRVFGFSLTMEDYCDIDAVLVQANRSQGHVYERERQQPDVRVKFLLNWMSSHGDDACASEGGPCKKRNSSVGSV